MTTRDEIFYYKTTRNFLKIKIKQNPISNAKISIYYIFQIIPRTIQLFLVVQQTKQKVFNTISVNPIHTEGGGCHEYQISGFYINIRVQRNPYIYINTVCVCLNLLRLCPKNVKTAESFRPIFLTTHEFPEGRVLSNQN